MAVWRRKPTRFEDQPELCRAVVEAIRVAESRDLFVTEFGRVECTFKIDEYGGASYQLQFADGGPGRYSSYIFELDPDRDPYAIDDLLTSLARSVKTMMGTRRYQERRRRAQ